MLKLDLLSQLPLKECLNVLKFKPLHIYLTLCNVQSYKNGWNSLRHYKRSCTICFSRSVISHVLSSVGFMPETKHVGIAEIAHDELSHNIFSL